MKAPTFPRLLKSHLRLPDEETLIFSPQRRGFHLAPNTYPTPMLAWWYSCAEGDAVIFMMGGRGGCGKCVSSCDKQKEGLFWRVHCCSVQCRGPPSPRGCWDPPEVSYVPTATLQHVLSGVSLKPHARGSLKRQKLISGLQLARHCVSVVGWFLNPMPRMASALWREE